MKKITVCLLLSILLQLIPSVGVNAGTSDELPVEVGNEVPAILINAINPGYTIDGMSNIGEFIELKKTSAEIVELTDIVLKYSNSSGNQVLLYQFPDGAQMVEETLLLRLASAPNAELADANYNKTLAFAAGPLELVWKDQTIASLCWTGKNDCYKSFQSATPTSLVWDEVNQVFMHAQGYVPTFNADKPSLLLPKKPDEVIEPKCKNVEFSEILTYYEGNKGEQFVELHNTGEEQVSLDACTLKYKNKSYGLSAVLTPDGYYARYATDFTLTKNPVSQNTIELIDADGSVVDSLTFSNGQKKAVAYAQFGYDDKGAEQWLQTFLLTPNEANAYQKFKSCSDGKVLNEETGNCVKSSTVDTTLEPCPEGKYRNPLTNRCKAYEAETELADCPDGYERNPKTKRCRKIVNNDGADYALEAENYEEKSNFLALWGIVAVLLVGIVYVLFQFRWEIKKLWQKIWSKKRK